MGSVPGSGRSPGGGTRNPLQYSCLGNHKDRGAWWATVHGVTKESDTAERLDRTSSSKIARLRPAHFGVKVPWAGDSILGTGPSLCYAPLSCLGCNSCSFPSFTGKIDPPNREGWKKPLEGGGLCLLSSVNPEPEPRAPTGLDNPSCEHSYQDPAAVGPAASPFSSGDSVPTLKMTMLLLFSC